MENLKSLKIRATKNERNRVFENFNLPPKDISVTYNGEIWIKKAWQKLNKFGWGKWEKI